MSVVDIERAVLAHVAYHVEQFGMDRTPTVDGTASLGRIICKAWNAAGASHETEACSAMMRAIAHAGGVDTLAELVAARNTREIGELVRELSRTIA